MKKFAVIIMVSLGLTGCFGSSDDDKDTQKKVEGFHVQEQEEFSLQIPDEWEVLTSQNFTSSMPKNTVLAVRSNIKNPLFTPNIAVLKNELSAEVSASDYAKALHQKTLRNLTSSREINVDKHVLQVSGRETESLFIYLEGRTQPERELKQFMQTAGVNGTTAYVVIGAFLANEGEDLAKKVETVVRSFEVK